MSEQFKDYVTGGAFHLSLSKRQVEMLCHIDQMESSFGYISTFGALEAKGLTERIDVPAPDESPDGVHFACRRVRLTEAGKALIPLIRLAGLYVELPKVPEPVDLPPLNIKIKPRYRKAEQPSPALP